MNVFYRSLSVEASYFGRVSGCLVGSAVAAITLVSAYIILARKNPVLIGLPFALVAHFYYYVYHPNVPAYDLLMVTINNPASLTNMVLLLCMPFVCATAAAHILQSATKKS